MAPELGPGNANPTIWIGITNHERNHSHWVDVSGQPLTYTNWHIGNPDIEDPHSDWCVYQRMYYASWNEWVCRNSAQPAAAYNIQYIIQYYTVYYILHISTPNFLLQHTTLRSVLKILNYHLFPVFLTELAQPNQVASKINQSCA